MRTIVTATGKSTGYCIVCLKPLKGQRRLYCSKECSDKRRNEQRKQMRKKRRRGIEFSLDDYGHMCRERDSDGKPWISYGKMQTKRYFDKKKEKAV